MKVDRPIVFFDGTCTLCNKCIEFLIRHKSSKSTFFITSLQGQTAKTLLPLHFLDSKNTLILYDSSGELLVKSEAVCFALKFLKKPWCYLQYARIIPYKLLDIIYDFISRNRFVWWKKKSQCRVPLDSERFYFLP